MFPKEYQRALRQTEEEKKQSLTNGPTAAVEKKSSSTVKDIEDVIPKQIDKIRYVFLLEYKYIYWNFHNHH